jgi:hypothetical protein
MSCLQLFPRPRNRFDGRHNQVMGEVKKKKQELDKEIAKRCITFHRSFSLIISGQSRA